MKEFLSLSLSYYNFPCEPSKSFPNCRNLRAESFWAETPSSFLSRINMETCRFTAWFSKEEDSTADSIPEKEARAALPKEFLESCCKVRGEKGSDLVKIELYPSCNTRPCKDWQPWDSDRDAGDQGGPRGVSAASAPALRGHCIADRICAPDRLERTFTTRALLLCVRTCECLCGCAFCVCVCASS